MAGIAAVLGPGGVIFMPWGRTNRWREAAEFPVPLCDAHRRRLLWPDYFLWGLLALVVIAVVVLVPTSLSILKNNSADIRGRIRTIETALSALLATTAVLIVLRIVLWLTTVPRLCRDTPANRWARRCLPARG
jgi:hypothetical protein